MKLIFVAGTVAVAALLAAAAPAFKPMTMDLPPDAATYPDGPNLKTVNQNCLACHSAEMVLDQPLLSKTAWAAEVAKMRNTYKAPVNEADAPLIVDYLTAVHGQP
jgi:cytochrome c5